MSRVKPVSPRDVVSAKGFILPDEVISAFNDCIAKHCDGGVSIFKQDDVVTLICSKMGCKRERVFEEGWLDVEDIYEKKGWRVDYDKPGYNETYPATFTFTAKRRGRQ